MMQSQRDNDAVLQCYMVDVLEQELMIFSVFILVQHILTLVQLHVCQKTLHAQLLIVTHPYIYQVHFTINNYLIGNDDFGFMYQRSFNQG